MPKKVRETEGRLLTRLPRRSSCLPSLVRDTLVMKKLLAFLWLKATGQQYVIISLFVIGYEVEKFRTLLQDSLEVGNAFLFRLTFSPALLKYFKNGRRWLGRPVQLDGELLEKWELRLDEGGVAERLVTR